ncbi:hypothetical protein BH23PLA1_BH23PLA1_43180 [soil metagenome]
MGVLKFRLTPPDLAEQHPELLRAYVTGLDRTPERVAVETRPGVLICQRENPESCRLHVPWVVDGVGMPYVSTATLIERQEPYDLAVELARGKLNDVRNQAADWSILGLRLPAKVEQLLRQARQAFARAATATDDPARASTFASESLATTFAAGRELAGAYSEQVLRKRLDHSPRLPTLLGCGLNSNPAKAPWSDTLAETINSARLRCSWAELAPTEGKFRWDLPDAQLDWCRRHSLMPMAGPILDFRPSALPDWLWLFQGDLEEITTMAIDLVEQAVNRYKGKVGFWHLVGRPASSEVLGLGEDDQIRLTAKVLQVARQIDPNTPIIVDFDRPWAEWMGSGHFQLGPLHLADSLSRAELGLSGIGLEIAPGFGPPGSHLRDLFEFSRLLDLYSLLNLPIHVTLAIPSAFGSDSKASPGVFIEESQWASTPSETSQNEMAAAWISLAVAKPFVRSVTWQHISDAEPHLYPNAGLFRPDNTAKPILAWLKDFHDSHLL